MWILKDQFGEIGEALYGGLMEQASEKPMRRNYKKKLLILVAVLAVAFILGGAYWWFVWRYHVSTDNAYVTADSVRLSSRVPGTVLRVMVANDQPVARGQVVVELDDRDYQAAVDQAEGALARVKAEISAMEVAVCLTDTKTAARVQEAAATLQEAREKKQERLHKLEELQKKRIAVQAELDKARRDFQRFEALYGRGAVSERQRDRTHTALVKAQADLEAIDAEVASVRSSLQAVNQEVEQAQAQLQAARGDRRQVNFQQQKLAALRGQAREIEAALKAARLNLSYCTIRAPVAGYIAQKSVQVGERVQAGQPLMAVVPLHDVYVEANFKETQLENIRLGQPATIEADAYPDHTYHGKVLGIRAGTGAAFSLLPAENATGNWVKVVQRVPVKIKLDEPPPSNYPLRVGLSLEVTVSTRDRSGAVLVPAPAKLKADLRQP